MSYVIVPNVSAANLAHCGPRHTHDCNCKFVGRLDRPELEEFSDVYLCGDSVIVRSGSHGPDYSCFPLSTARAIAADQQPGLLWHDALLCLDLWAKAVLQEPVGLAP